MAQRRLNVLARLSIVVTALLLLGGTIGVDLYAMNQRRDAAAGLYTVCVAGYDQLQQQFPAKDYTADRGRCSADADAYRTSQPPAWTVLVQSFLGVATIVAAFWGLALIIYGVLRWITQGRERRS